MPPSRPLRDAFLGGLPEAQREAVAADPLLDAHLARLVARAREAWPTLEADAAGYVAHVAARLGDGAEGSADLGAALDGLRAGDLWVAHACLAGSREAVALLEARFVADVEGALARMRLAGGTDDVKQALRVTILVGDGDAPPRIAAYAGRGDLRAWLRVTAVRSALKVIRRQRREAHVDDDVLLDAAAPTGDPELGYLKEVYRAAFRTAFQEALDGLEDREKNVLRQHVVDRVSIDELGAMYGVHRATAARWIERARENLLARTRASFMARAKVSRGELESILRLVQSQLDGTIRRRFEAIAGGDR